MSVVIAEHDVTVHLGDVRDELAKMAAGSVQCIVTSPPYYGLRDYGVEGQLGLEASPAEYVETMRAVFAEARRVLRADGTLWLNIGDSYYSGRGKPGPNGADRKHHARRGFTRPLDKPSQPWGKPKSLLGIPDRLVSTLQNDGWYRRDDIAWCKPNAMRGPQDDRFGSAWERIYLLSKSRRYWFDRPPGDDWADRNFWLINTEPNDSAHCAPFPAELARRCIIAGCPPAVCTSCGHAPKRIVVREPDESRTQARRALDLARVHGLTPEHIAAIRSVGISDAGKGKLQQSGTGRNSARVQELFTEAKNVLGGYTREFLIGKRVTQGWTSCGCNAPMIPGTVLDLFIGAGTTAVAALDLGRKSIGIELNPGYIPIIEQRIGPAPLDFGEVTA